MRNDSNAALQQGLAPRRSQGVYVQIRVRVEGCLKNGTPFAEETETFYGVVFETKREIPANRNPLNR
jgi:hypothetical protein